MSAVLGMRENIPRPMPPRATLHRWQQEVRNGTPSSGKKGRPVKLTTDVAEDVVARLDELQTEHRSPTTLLEVERLVAATAKVHLVRKGHSDVGFSVSHGTLLSFAKKHVVAKTPDWTTSRRDEARRDLRSWASYLGVLQWVHQYLQCDPELLFNTDATTVIAPGASDTAKELGMSVAKRGTEKPVR